MRIEHGNNMSCEESMSRNEESMSRKKGDRHVVAMRKRQGVMEAQKEV